MNPGIVIDILFTVASERFAILGVTVYSLRMKLTLWRGGDRTREREREKDRQTDRLLCPFGLEPSRSRVEMMRVCTGALEVRINGQKQI